MRLTFTASDHAPKGPWRRQSMTWPEFVEWLDLDHPADVRECGGYVGGVFDGRRTEESVTDRCLLTLDADSAGLAFITDVALTLDCAWVAHTTWRSTPEAQRWRIIIPLDTTVDGETYWTLAHVVMDAIGREHFDDGSAQHERFMYRPSAGAHHLGRMVGDGEALDVAGWLDGAEVAPRHRERAEASAERGEEYDGTEASPGQVDKARAVLNKACAEIRSGDVTRNVGCIRWLPVLYRFVLGGCLDREVVDGLVWEATQAAPADEPFPRSEWETVSGSAWGYAEADGPDRPEVEDEPEFGVVEVDPAEIDHYDDYSLADAHLGERVGRDYLRGRYIAWGQKRWAVWDGRKWDLWATETTMVDVVRRALLDIAHVETGRADERRDREVQRAGGDATAVRDAHKAHEARMKQIRALWSLGKIMAALKVARGVVQHSMSDFDSVRTHDWLNVANGMVNLRTGELIDHDPAMLFTQVSPVPYVAGAEHPDWKSALTALPDDVASWMQVRFGQAATGKATADDVVPFLKGGGENGKTTVLLGVKRALGEFCVPVPEKVLTASPSDHPTELFSLKGVRLALLEELPGGDFLNISRLKRIVGTETGMQARPIGENNVTWDPTHSLMVTTNHDVQIPDADHGTWRRLALVEFPYTFGGPKANRPKDDTLRDRIRDGEDGQWEAALAWVVAGAVRFYRDGLERERDTPAAVVESTREWQFKANHPARFIDEMLVYTGDPDQCVRVSEVYQMFVLWMSAQGYKGLTDRTFWERATAHELFSMEWVERKVVKTKGRQIVALGMAPIKGSERVVTGVRFGESAEQFEAGLL